MELGLNPEMICCLEVQTVTVLGQSSGGRGAGGIVWKTRPMKYTWLISMKPWVMSLIHLYSFSYFGGNPRQYCRSHLENPLDRAAPVK